MEHRHRRTVALLGAASLVVTLSACSGGRTGGSSAPATRATPVSSGTLDDLHRGIEGDLRKLGRLAPGSYVLSGRAADHVGQTKRVCGPVQRVRFDVGDTRLYLGQGNDSEEFGIVVWDDPDFVEEMSARDFEGSVACITGKIIDEDGIAQIQTRKPRDLWLS